MIYEVNLLIICIKHLLKNYHSETYLCEDLQRYTVMVTTAVVVSHSHPPTPSTAADVHNNQNSLVKVFVLTNRKCSFDGC